MGVEPIKTVKSSHLLEHEGLNLHFKHPEEQTLSSEAEQKKAATAEVDQAEVSKNVKMANEFLKTMDTRLEYQYDQDLDREIVKVVNQDNGEVVRQLPAEEVVKMLTKMHELLGVMFDRKF